VDDAHSTGILGKNGRGTPEHFKLTDNENIYQTETMSKALGGYGGFISGSKELTELIREKSTIYQASTALPPPIVAAGSASLRLIMENPDMRIKLLETAGDLRQRIIGLGFRTTTDNTPIIPVMLSELTRAKDLSLFLESNGIIVPFINYPVRQEKYLLRIAVSITHTVDQIEELVENLTKWKDNYGTD
jgi:7-keto-8-aminopelargonate synthetase-like enzyme